VRAMAKYLTQEWLDLQKQEAADFPERPGATARMQYVVTGGPDGELSYYTVIDNGKIVENALGTDDQSEFTITSTWDDSVKIAKGELDPNAAFMQGKMKVTGNMGKLMSLMPLTQSAEYKAISEKVKDQTDF
jgi:putative sterol carrier protein